MPSNVRTNVISRIDLWESSYTMWLLLGRLPLEP
jgi:hypothetical protein